MEDEDSSPHAPHCFTSVVSQCKLDFFQSLHYKQCVKTPHSWARWCIMITLLFLLSISPWVDDCIWRVSGTWFTMYLLPAHCSLLTFHNSLLSVLWYFRCPRHPRCPEVLCRALWCRSALPTLLSWLAARMSSLGFLHDFPGVLFHLLLGLGPLISSFLKIILCIYFLALLGLHCSGLFSSYGTQGMPSSCGSFSYRWAGLQVREL